MKKTIVLMLFMLLFAGVVLAAGTPEKQFKVIVEGVDEAKANTTTAAVHIISAKDQEIARLKAMTQGTSMEMEIFDALIGKVINLEEDIAKMKKTETMLFGLFSVLFIIMLAFIFTAWKKFKD